MCYGHVDLKHLERETESRLAGLPQVDRATGARTGLLARLRDLLAAQRSVPPAARGDVQP